MGGFLKWIPKSPWVSILKWSNLDYLGVTPNFRKPPCLILSISRRYCECSKAIWDLLSHELQCAFKALTASLSFAIWKNSCFCNLPSSLASLPGSKILDHVCWPMALDLWHYGWLLTWIQPPNKHPVSPEAPPIIRFNVSLTQVIWMASFSAAATAVITWMASLG